MQIGDIDTSTTPLPSNQESVGHDKEDRPRVRIGSSGGSQFRNSLEVNFNGLDTRELELMEGMENGHQWVTCKNGRLEAVPTYKPLPEPVQDEMMLPFWRPPTEGVETQLEMFPFEPMPSYSSPSITIQHLCGYNYSAENYRFQAALLQRWGFECLRSRRAPSGQFWEIWYLGSLWFAKEELKKAIDSAKIATEVTERSGERKKLRVAINYLCHNASFGTLDASFQRAAMGVD